ncbi:hypothetical protein ARSEF1564_007214 [Beauveria bassiana]
MAIDKDLYCLRLSFAGSKSEKSKASIEEEFFDGLVYQLNTPGNNLGKPAAEHNDASYHSFIILDICVIVEVLIRRLPRFVNAGSVGINSNGPSQFLY